MNRSRGRPPATGRGSILNVKTPPLQFTTINPHRPKGPQFFEIREDEDGSYRVTCNGLNVDRFTSKKLAESYYEARLNGSRAEPGGFREWKGNCPKCRLDGRKNTLALERSGGLVTKECDHCGYRVKVGPEPR